MQQQDESTCDIWYQVLLARATDYAGGFFVGVKTTGVFCISTCRARKPKRANVLFYSDFSAALAAGFRPCKVCRPTENAFTAPPAVEQALALLRTSGSVKVSDAQLREHSISPETIRRWFIKNHGMTFQAYQRMLRVNTAMQELKSGRKAIETAYDSGYDSLSGFGYTFKKLTGHAPTHRAQAIVIQRFTTPLGPMFVCATENGVCLLEFVDRRALETEFSDIQRMFAARIIAGENEHTRQAVKEIGEYFAGERQIFTLALDAPGTTFQQQVWQALREVGYAGVSHYGMLAQQIGNPKAVRAVASANGANRIAIVIPCHRIIGKDGSMTGYGGGIARKQWLLEHEAKYQHSAE